MSWEAWKLDGPTWAFIIWWLWFFGWESVALFSDYYHGTWTAHFRPIFTEASLSWFVGQGILFWFWIHIFYPRVEVWLLEAVKLPPSGL